ncbi:hypothetical protein [Paenibacillus polymyxa]|uniref:hypothetical protein n=1 Tax=Paenibacillus polymyxa TaxID=1406 RepID=UPI0025B67C1E|nr:hypothetical protein [Paenibacillus polymyxa]MDN4106143.1 hypothetical protein [Paenibacillus polymyxa]
MIESKEGQFYVYLVYKVSEEIYTPIRQFIDVLETEPAANDFAKSFVLNLQKSVQNLK